MLITTNALMWPMFRAFGMHPWHYLSTMLALHALNVLVCRPRQGGRVTALLVPNGP